MNGLILSDCGSVCSCGGAFKTIFNEIIKAKYPACNQCQKPPKNLRLKKSFPNKDGSVFYGWFRFTLDGEPLDSVMKCIELIGQLNKEIHSPDFRIEKYNPKAREKMTAEFLLAEYLKTSLKRTSLPQQHRKYLSPGGYRKIKTNVTCHLLKFFKERKIDRDDLNEGESIPWYIEEINHSSVILSFYDSYLEHFRARDNALGELKSFLNWVKEEFGYIKEIAKFPEIQQARLRSAEEIPSLDVQELIVKAIKDPQYRTMFEVASVTTVRPSELVSYHVRDHVYNENRIYTGRHLSDGGPGFARVPISGRKSIEGHKEGGIVFHTIDVRLNEILRAYSEGRDPDEPLFPGKISKYVALTTLRKAWNEACEIVGVKVQPYVGTKHATLSDDFTESGSMNKTRKRSKHKDEKSLKRYAMDKSEEEILSSERFALKKVVGAELVQEDFDNVISLQNYRLM